MKILWKMNKVMFKKYFEILKVHIMFILKKKIQNARAGKENFIKIF